MSRALRANADILARVLRRESALAKALAFRARLCADEPTADVARSLRKAARRYCRPLSKDAGTLAEGGLDSELLGFDGSKARARFKVSAVRRDRHGDVVRPRGCLGTLADYAANKQVFFAHASDCFPVATAGDPQTDELALEVEEDCIYSDACFHLKTQESQDVCELVDAGVLKAASIGFFPLVGEVIEGAMSPDELETASVVDFDFGGFDFTEWSLVEWSVVPVPANPDALRGHLSRARKMAGGVRRALEPFATPKRSDRPRAGWYAHVAKSGKKPFDVTAQKLRPASLEFDFAAKHLGCEVKEIAQQGTHVPAAKMGGFLCGWRDVTFPHPKLDVRNLTYDGREAPPVHETIQLNSTKSDDFLVEGVVFHDGAVKFVAALSRTWYGLGLTLYSRAEHRKDVRGLVDKAWDLAASQYNFLKGEAFSLTGEFLKKTDETWADIFLTEKNTKALTRTLTQLNAKQAAFANRGTLMTGPPGTGKTLSGRVIRNEANATFIWVAARDFYRAGAFGGIEYAFELAKELGPAVLFFEDVDTWLGESSVDLLKSTMDGIGRSSGTWTILTTNFPERLPEALIDRPGRFHDVLLFAAPDADCRKAMLAKWLPGLPADDLDAAVKSTAGYSGAHLYELAHFARTLQEQDEIPLPDAFAQALTKVAEQRELVGKVTGRGGSRSRRQQFDYDGEELSSPLPRVASYKAGRSHALPATSRNKAVPPTPDPTPDLQDRPGTGPSPDAEVPDDQSAQAVVLSPQRFHSVDECAQWLEENGYATDNIVPGDEADEPWVAVQFPADSCEAGTGHRDEVEEGVYVVFCQRKPEAGPDDGASGAEEIKPPVTEPKNAAAPAPKTKAPDPSQLPMRGVDDAVKPGDEKEETYSMPHGATVLKGLHEHLMAAHEHLKAEHPRMEETPAKKAVAKLHEHVVKAAGMVCEAGKKHYPDHLSDLETPELDGENAAAEAHEGEEDRRDEEEGEETSRNGKKAPKPYAKLAKKDVGVVADAAEFLTEIAGHPSLKKTEKSAAKLHANELSSLQQKYSKPAEEAEAAKAAVLEEKAAQDFIASVEKTRELFYSLTGQEI